MRIAEDLRRLAQELADAYEERVKTINQIKRETEDLKRETADTLGGFAQERVEMGGALRADLAKFRVDLTDGTTGLLVDFSNAHDEMAEELRADLAKFKSDLEKDTTELLDVFGKAHDEMAQELRSFLTKFKADLDAAERERKAGDQAEIGERGDYITDLREKAQDLLEEFDKAHGEMAKDLRDVLAKAKAALKAGESERKAAVGSELAAVKAEIEDAASAWKKLVSRMSSIRRQVTITGLAEVKAAVKTKTVEEAIEEEELEGEEAEYEDLKDQIVDLLDENPDGLRMVEIADHLGVPNWRSLIPVMRELLDKGEVRKEDSTYYVE